jgi:hypothetical protein
MLRSNLAKVQIIENAYVLRNHRYRPPSGKRWVIKEGWHLGGGEFVDHFDTYDTLEIESPYDFAKYSFEYESEEESQEESEVNSEEESEASTVHSGGLGIRGEKHVRENLSCELIHTVAFFFSS